MRESMWPYHQVPATGKVIGFDMNGKRSAAYFQGMTALVDTGTGHIVTKFAVAPPSIADDNRMKHPKLMPTVTLMGKDGFSFYSVTERFVQLLELAGYAYNFRPLDRIPAGKHCYLIGEFPQACYSESIAALKYGASLALQPWLELQLTEGSPFPGITEQDLLFCVLAIKDTQFLDKAVTADLGNRVKKFCFTNFPENHK